MMKNIPTTLFWACSFLKLLCEQHKLIIIHYDNIEHSNYKNRHSTKRISNGKNIIRIK